MCYLKVETRLNPAICRKIINWPFKTFLASYEGKVEIGTGTPIEVRDISIGDELSTCMWLKLTAGTWENVKGDIANLVRLEMKGIFVITRLSVHGDSLNFNFFYHYHPVLYGMRHGISER